MKKYMLALGFAFLSFIGFAQTHYIKLKQPIEHSKSLTNKVQKEFEVTFVKSELLSDVLNAPVYKVQYNLSKSQAKQLHELFKEDSQVVYSSFMMNPVAPPSDIPPTTPDYSDQQSYLDPDPGMDVKFAWDQNANGSNVSVHTVEYSLTLGHEEFIGRNIGLEQNMSVNVQAEQWVSHGTTTAGAIFADRGEYGVVGIAYNADGYTLYPEWQLGLEWDRPFAVGKAINAAAEGDIIVYEMQWEDANEQNVPAEYDPIIWDLTKAATERGMVVVAAAGNGGVNLDLPEHTDYANLGDSGAILVGASTPDLTHASYAFSTYGSRVNVNSWGTNVMTTGYGFYLIGDDENQSYTPFFNGTSSATAISGGAAAVLQSFYYDMTGGYLSSMEMREVLMTTGISQPISETRRIGSFINLKAAIEHLTLLSTQDEVFENQLLIYPNPVGDLLTVKNPNNLELSSYELYDALGKRIQHAKVQNNSIELNVSSLSQGVYYLKILSKDQIGTKQIIKK